MNQYYELLTSIIACSKLEQAIMLLRHSQLFTSHEGVIREFNEGFTTSNIDNSPIPFVESKYFRLQFITNSIENIETIQHFFGTIVKVLDDKKDASSETLQKKRSKQELDIFTIFAHEFRTPLTVIQSSVELLLDFFPEWDTEKITAFLQSIQQQTSSISRLLEMIAELYDARSNSQDVITVKQQSIESFFQQIESILSKRFLFTISIVNFNEHVFEIRIPIRALMYIMSVALQSFESQKNSSSITISSNQNNELIIDIISSHKIFNDNELRLLDLLFSENIIEDVSGEWLPYLLASICAQYLNASISIENIDKTRASFKLFLQG